MAPGRDVSWFLGGEGNSVFGSEGTVCGRAEAQCGDTKETSSGKLSRFMLRNFTQINTMGKIGRLI